jgi:mannose-1-phosphate guanylyltransferase
MRHAVIMAGGAGLRLWPLSRHDRPKQLLRLFGGSSLLRTSFERVAGLLDPAQINVITQESFADVVAAELPELPRDNIIGEPVGRDTANAVGLSAALIRRRDPDAVMGIFTADHMISPPEEFRLVIEKAFRAAESDPEALVTIGIRPARADTNFGYIHRGGPLGDDVFTVQKFIEKPGVGAAMKYLASGEYYWNSGMFVWRASTILEQLRQHLPQSHAALEEIAAAWNTTEGRGWLESLYPTLMRISIDFAVLERAERVIVVEMDCHWVDVGSWPSIEAVIQADTDGNVNACEDVVHLASRGNIVVSEEKHLIATVGVDDLVIVHAPDVTLICTRRDASAIKELLEMVRRQFGDKYA